MIEFETYWGNILDPDWQYSAGYIEDLKASYTFHKKGDDSVLINATAHCADFLIEPVIERDEYDEYHIKEALLHADGIDYFDDFEVYDDEDRYYKTDINGVAEIFGCSVNDIENYLNSKEVVDYITNYINEYDIAECVDVWDFVKEEIDDEDDRW